MQSAGAKVGPGLCQKTSLQHWAVAIVTSVSSRTAPVNTARAVPPSTLVEQLERS